MYAREHRMYVHILYFRKINNNISGIVHLYGKMLNRPKKFIYIFICIYEFGVWSEDMAIHENISIFLSVVPTYMLCYV